MSPLQEFLALAARLDAFHRYRTVYDADLSVLLPGKEDIDASALAAFSRMDFRGKSVVDVGCNLGFFTFQAKRLGAARVVGVDREQGVLDGCELLRRHFGLSGVTFERHDIAASPRFLATRRFDVAMLLEFIGKNCVVQNQVAPVLASLECLAERELVVSVQKSYWIRKELRTTAQGLRALYPARYVVDGAFCLLDYVCDRLAPRWRMEALSELAPGYEKPRKYVRFERKMPPAAGEDRASS